MGVDIGDIVPTNTKKISEFAGKTVAIDAFNTLYQFLSTIRQPNGTPLVDDSGRITSHISGLFYRSANFIEHGMKIIYVFDGVPSQLKLETIKERRARREEAEEEWKEALRRGDFETARIKAKQSAKLTTEMIDEAKELLDLMGIPHVQAPSEGEAQASRMVMKEDAWAVASQDFDSLLFGCPVLIRNLAITGKRKLPRRNVYVNVEPEVISLSDVFNELGITREQLVDIGILVGTDFNEGIKGIGPKKALNLIRKYGSIKNIIKEKKIEIPDYEIIREIFLNPEVTDNYEINWGTVDDVGIINFLCNERQFSEERVRNTLSRILEKMREKSQTTLDSWF